MKYVIDIPKGMLDELRTCNFPIQEAYRLCEVVENGTPLPEGAEILTKEAYSDLCLRASRIPCYLESPCEYQNENIEIPQCEYIVWHPYPEEKPKVNGDYNVTLKYSKCTATAYYEVENDGWRSDNGFYVPNRCITAWVELPKPYVKGAEDGRDTDE